MPILNYTTSIEASKTVSEIQKILVSHGATSILTNYDSEGMIESLSFKVKAPTGEEVPIKLPVEPEAVLKVMSKYGSHVPYRYQNKAQAVRVAWRIIKDWTEAQMALLETQMVKIDQIFLPYTIIRDDKTAYQIITESRLQLEVGNNEEHVG